MQAIPTLRLLTHHSAAPAATYHMMASRYSVREYFSDGAVLLTGGTGYLGILTLEKLLRCTNVSKVYLLMRSKRGQRAEARLQKLLSQPVMHLLRGNAVLHKVYAVAGDICAGPGLGISPEDLQLLQREVKTVIHSAADIRLEVGIQDLLRANYEGTRNLLDIVRSFNNLEAFVHVSSAYTNMNAPHGSLVKESIYPLSFGDQQVDDAELVKELLVLPAHTANLRAEGLLVQWNFPNNYTLSKHLAEYMVADYQKYFDLPVSIVRPTLISSVARDPYPGYTGNFAGHVGAVVAFWAGLFSHPSASNYKASNVWDVIPSDVVANVILAAAAAVGQGVAADCIATPALLPPEGAAAASAAASVAAADAAEAADAADAAGAAAVAPKGLGSKALTTVREVLRKQHKQKQPGTHPHHQPNHQPNNHQHHHQPNHQQQQSLLIVHSASSTTYPLTIMESWNVGCEVLGAWAKPPNINWAHCAPPLTAGHEPNPTLAALHLWLSGLKIWLAATLLRWMKRERTARNIQIGFESFKVINQPKLDVNLRFSTNNMQRLAALLEPSEQEDFLLLWRPAAAGAVGAAPGGRDGSGSASNPSMITSKQSLCATAAQLASSALNSSSSSNSKATDAPLARRPSLLAAQASGTPVMETRSSNSSSSGGGVGLESSEDSDRDSDTASTDSDTTSNSDKTAGNDSNSSEAGSFGDNCTPFAAGAAWPGAAPDQKPHCCGAVLSAAQREEVCRMRGIPIQWRAFHINLGAFIYSTVFKMPLPPKMAPIIRPEIARWLGIKPNDMFVEHSCNLYA